MTRYVIRRLLTGILVLAGVVFVIFSLFLLINVDPARMTLGQRADVAGAEAVRERLGLDRPWYSRMALYTGNLMPVWVHGNSPEQQAELNYVSLIPLGANNVLAAKAPYLGRSFQTGRRVGDMLLQGLANTLVLAALALVIALKVGLSLGILAALQAGRWPDQAVVTLSSIGVSVPSYFSAIVLSFVFGYLLSHITGLHMFGNLYDLEGNLAPQNLILPAIALGIRPVAVITQLTRSAMLDVLGQDYVRTARAKGLSPARVVGRHALRNALNPVVTSVSGWLASLLTGAYFVEVIFSYKGLGSLTIRAIESYDFPVIMGAVLLGATVFVLLNILADLLYAWLDPKVRLS